MSKIGEKPIIIKEGVKVVKGNGQVVVTGSLGELTVNIPESLSVNFSDNEIKVGRSSDEKKVKSVHGTINRLIYNAIEGVTSGFTKTLEVVGTGYRSSVEGKALILFLGFSHPVNFQIPDGIKIEAVENKIKVFGIDKQLVGLTADRIKKLKKPDPYKGKGIRYFGEKLKLKPGKAAAKAGVTTGGK